MPATSRIIARGLQFADAPVSEAGVFAVAGRNFMPVRDGVRSYFGSRLNCLTPVAGSYLGFFRVQGTPYYFSEEGVFECCNGGALCKVLALCLYDSKQPCDYEYPWTMAFTGDAYYFSHPTIGIIEYDVKTKTWEQLPIRELGFSDLIFGITEANGSLIVLSRDTVTYSSFQNGRALIENEYAGIGTQSLHLAKFGRPLGIYSDGFGFFTFTTNGIMYSQPLSGAQILSGENIETAAVFRHRAFDVSDLPLNAYSITQYGPSLVAYLSSNGLMQIGRFDNNQFSAQTLAPAFSRWFREEIAPCFECEMLEPKFSRLYYGDNSRKLYVSLGIVNNYDPKHGVFGLSYVYDRELEQWGSFNMPHLFIHEEKSNNATADGYYDPYGYSRYFDETIGAIKYEISAPIVYSSWAQFGYLELNDSEDATYLTELNEFNVETKDCPDGNQYDLIVHDKKRNCDNTVSPIDCAKVLEPYKTLNCVNYYRNTNLTSSHSFTIESNNRNSYWYIRGIVFSIRKRGKL